MPNLKKEDLNEIYNKLYVLFKKNNSIKELACKQCDDYLNGVDVNYSNFIPLTYYYIISKLDGDKQISFILENSSYIKNNADKIFKIDSLEMHSIFYYLQYNGIKKIRKYDKELFIIMLNMASIDFYHNFSEYDINNLFDECYEEINSLSSSKFLELIHLCISDFKVDTAISFIHQLHLQNEMKKKFMNLVCKKYIDKINQLNGTDFLKFINLIKNNEDFIEFIKLNKDKIDSILKSITSSSFEKFISDLDVSIQYSFTRFFKNTILSSFKMENVINSFSVKSLYILYKEDKNKFTNISVESWLRYFSINQLFNTQMVLNDYGIIRDEYKKMLLSFKNINFKELFDKKIYFSSYFYYDYSALEILELNYRNSVNVFEDVEKIDTSTSIFSNTYISNLAKIKYLLKNKIISKSSDIYKKHFTNFILYLKQEKIIEEIDDDNFKTLDQFFYSIIMKNSLTILFNVSSIEEIAITNKAHDKIVDCKCFSLKQIESFNLKQLNSLCCNKEIGVKEKTMILKLIFMVGYDNAKRILNIDCNITTLEHLTKNIDVKNVLFDNAGNPILNKKIMNLLFSNNCFYNVLRNKNEKVYTYFPRIFNEWNMICENNKDKNLKSIIDYLDSDTVSLSPKYYRLKGLFKYIGCDCDVVSNALKLHDEMLMRYESTIPKITGELRSYSYEILDMDDMEILAIGDKTNCCFTVNGNAKTSLRHAALDINGRVLKVKKDGKIIAQSWLWRRGNLLCIDNIETNKSLDEIDFLDVYLDFANKIVLETERFEKDNAIRIVTLGYRSFDKQIVDIINYPTLISNEGMLEKDKYKDKIGNNYMVIDFLPQPINYDGYTDSNYVQFILKGDINFDLKQSNYIYNDARKDIIHYDSSNEYDADFLSEVDNIVNDFLYREFELLEKDCLYEHVEIDRYKEIYCNYDWLITIDNDGNINKYFYSNNKRVCSEMEDIIFTIDSNSKKKSIKFKK